MIPDRSLAYVAERLPRGLDGIKGLLWVWMSSRWTAVCYKPFRVAFPCTSVFRKWLAPVGSSIRR